MYTIMKPYAILVKSFSIKKRGLFNLAKNQRVYSKFFLLLIVF